MPDFGLGRVHVPDPRDAAYPLEALLPAEPAKIQSRFWTVGSALNQGQTPRCVAFGWKDWLISEPIPDDPAALPDVDTIYADAQSQDGIPGAHDGSTVRAGAKVMQDEGRISAYHWSQNADDVAQYLVGSCALLELSQS